MKALLLSSFVLCVVAALVSAGGDDFHECKSKVKGKVLLHESDQFENSPVPKNEAEFLSDESKAPVDAGVNERFHLDPSPFSKNEAELESETSSPSADAGLKEIFAIEDSPVPKDESEMSSEMSLAP